MSIVAQNLPDIVAESAGRPRLAVSSDDILRESQVLTKSDRRINAYLIVTFIPTAISSVSPGMATCRKLRYGTCEFIPQGHGYGGRAFANRESSIGGLIMTFFHQFSVFAASRGEGLHPKLRVLLERAALSPFSDVSVRYDGLIQAGPSPDSEVASSRINMRLEENRRAAACIGDDKISIVAVR